MDTTSAAEIKWKSTGLVPVYDEQYTNNSEEMDTIKIAVMEDPWFYYGTSGVNTKRDTQSIKQELDSLIDQIDEDAVFASHNVANWGTFDVAEKEALSPQLLVASIFKSSINNAMEEKSQEKSTFSNENSPLEQNLENSKNSNSAILENSKNSSPAILENSAENSAENVAENSVDKKTLLINAIKNELGEQVFENLSNRDAQMLSILNFSAAQMSSAVDAVFDIIETYAPLQPPKIIELSHALKAYYGSNASIFEHYKKASLLLAIEDSFNDFVASSNVNLLTSDSVDMALI